MTMQHDEIYLADLWRTLRNEWRSFVAALLLVLLIAATYGLLAPPRWEAQGWIQVGQVGFQPTGQDPRPEPFQRVVERLQSVGFQNAVVQGVGVALASPESRLYRTSLKVEPSPYAGLIKLSVRATSPALARRFVQATVDQLRAIHGRLQAAPMAQARERMDRLQSELRDAIVARDNLREAAGATDGKDRSVATTAGLMLAGAQTQVRELSQARDELAARLGGNYTFATSMPWPIYQQEGPVSPNRVLIAGMGLFGGLAVGVFAAVARGARRRAMAQPKSLQAALTP